MGRSNATTPGYPAFSVVSLSLRRPSLCFLLILVSGVLASCCTDLLLDPREGCSIDGQRQSCPVLNTCIIQAAHDVDAAHSQTRDFVRSNTLKKPMWSLPGCHQLRELVKTCQLLLHDGNWCSMRQLDVEAILSTVDVRPIRAQRKQSDPYLGVFEPDVDLHQPNVMIELLLHGDIIVKPSWW